MPTKIAINGFGRIGRCVLRALTERGIKDLEVVAINDLTDAKTLAHLYNYDTVHRTAKVRGTAGEGSIDFGRGAVKILAEKDPGTLPWKDVGVSLVLECTGLFTDKEKTKAHFDAGAKKVLISAPAKGQDATIVLGVNQGNYDGSKHHLLSNGSCTTNCLAPVAKVLHEGIGIVGGLMTTIHAYTNDQVLTDVYHTDLRRARSATMSMIPTKTGAASALGLVLPALKGKLDGYAVRVPTINVSLVDLTFIAQRATTVEEVNQLMRAAAQGPLKGVLAYTSEPLVSVDYNHDPHSSTYDDTMTKVSEGKLVKVCSWYDNEWGFSNRVLDVVAAWSRAK